MNGTRALAVLTLALAFVAEACGGGAGTPVATSSSATSTATQQDVAWAGDAASAKALADLYDAAKKANETQLVMYGRYTEAYRPIWDVFEKRFPGIKLTGKVLPGAGTTSTIQAEVSSGQHVGDLVMQGLETVEVAADANLLDPYEPVNLSSLTLGPDYQDKTRRFIAQFGDVFGVLYNTSKMKAADVPKTLKDLGDPKYKGYVIDDPKAGLVTSFCWMAMLASKKITEDELQGIKTNATVVQDATPYYQKLTTGELAMMPWAAHSRYVTLKGGGAPLEFSATPGLSILVLGGTGIIKGAPHPNVAKLFSTWFLTPEAQKALVDLGNSYALRTGTSYPSDWPNADQLNAAIPQIPPGKVHQALVDEIAFAGKVFK